MLQTFLQLYFENFMKILCSSKAGLSSLGKARTEQHSFKNANNCFECQNLLLLRDIRWKSYNLYLNVHFFNTSVELDICGGSRQFSCIVA
jgi:hypothetical protein